MYKGDEDLGNGVIIRKSRIGFGGVVNPRTTRPFAVQVNGEFLRTASGKIRTFASREEAKKFVKGPCS